MSNRRVSVWAGSRAVVSRADYFWLWICPLICVAAVLCTVPVLEMGVNDDWSYTRTALDLAEAHRFIYNGQSAMPLGPHALIGALGICLFGFSFTAVRLMMLPVVAACTVMLYVLARHCALSEPGAAFATLALLLSPVTVPLSASYMTDVTGLFFLLAAMYCGSCVVASERPTAALSWILTEAVFGLLGGMVRQYLWITVVVLVPLSAWLRLRRLHRMQLLPATTRAGRLNERAIWHSSVMLAGFGGILAVLCMKWFMAQPYTVSDGLFPTLDSVRRNHESYSRYLKSMLPTFTLLVLPALVLCVHTWHIARAPRSRTILVLACLASVAGSLHTVRYGASQGWPYWGNVFMPNGPFPGLAIGNRPFLLATPIRFAIVAATFFFCIVGFVDLAREGWRMGTTRRMALSTTLDTLPAPLILLLAFSTLYMLLLVLRLLAYPWVADRYLIPILPAILFLLIRRREQHAMRNRSWLAGTVVLGGFAVYGIATTHDYFAAARARLTAADEVVGSSVPRRLLHVGFEYDSWTQLEISGRVNSQGLRPEERTPGTPACAIPYPYAAATPSIDGIYFVVDTPLPGLAPAPYSPVFYRTWLPPYRSSIYVQQVITPSNSRRRVMTAVRSENHLSARVRRTDAE